MLRVYSSSPIGGVYADVTADLISQHRQVRGHLHLYCWGVLVRPHHCLSSGRL